ncbi:MAG: choice-of-anchor O protein [Gammaproteobacteria bacterium]|nr:choice-of-anchor O protein [Gammaproteobacteria bacterium]MDH4253153.1 choice-of-anchor O protein [Gammaproteobacteria bacterium]MDH5308485.1 choice-of-anchor O protein [Gammaproteobacteria bacterium]
MNSSNRHSKFLLGCIVLLAPPALAYTELDIADEAIVLTPDLMIHADKARILDMPDGTLVVFWHAQNGTPGQAWDLFGNTFAPRDIFARTSTDGGVTWGEIVNISDTARMTDPSVVYDSVGDGSGVANFYGDSDKPTVFASGGNVVVIWSDTWCGPGVHGPARYEVPLGLLEVPYRCLYASRMTVAAGAIDVIATERLTDGARDVTNEVHRGTGAGFAIAWQEDPNGLQLGEARGEGDGSSGARVSPGTDIWYTWIPGSSFADPAKTWRTPVPVSDNFDYGTGTVTGGGASRPLLALAGSPPTAILVYEEAKNAGPDDPGKYVRYHQFAGSSPPEREAGTIISNPAENARRARITAQGSPGPLGTRVAIMWRQGAGIMGAPADFMMRVGRVPAGTSLATSPNAGFRVEDLWPAVDATDPTANGAPLNLSGASVDDESSIDPLADAKAHRDVMDGDFIFAAYTQDANVEDPAERYAYFGRWSDDGGTTWSQPLNVSGQTPGGMDVIEPRLLRTPSGTNSGKPEDVRNPDAYLFAWGTQTVPDDGSEPQRSSLYLTRSMDRGVSLEPVQSLDVTRTSASQTDEQIQLKITPDGEQVAMVWVRFDGAVSSVAFATAQGVRRTADLSVAVSAADLSPDIGVGFDAVISVQNAGPDAATGTTLDIDVPAGLAVDGVAASTGSCQAAGSIECAFDSLAAGSNVAVTLALVAEDAEVHVIRASASALEVEPTPGDNEAELRIEGTPNADLWVTATPSVTDATTGDDFSIDVTIGNDGPQAATDVRLVLRLSDKLVVKATQGCAIGTLQVDCAISAIAPGERVATRAIVGAQAIGRATVGAQVEAAEQDPVAGNDTAEFTVDVTGSLGGGCVYRPDGRGADTLLALMLALASLRLLPRPGRREREVACRD